VGRAPWWVIGGRLSAPSFLPVPASGSGSEIRRIGLIASGFGVFGAGIVNKVTKK
jgi:hypothetical protein